MKTVVIAGASGVVGTEVLHQLLARDDIGRIVATGRRPLPLQHPKLVSSVVDLQNRHAIAAEIPDRTAVAFCCLGTTMKKAGRKDFTKLFKKAKLKPKAVLDVRVLQTGAIGRVDRFVIRNAKLPKREQRCLPPGVKKPVRC